MGKIIFILGGARSGKSAFALERASKYKKVAFLATAQAKDAEMLSRINIHKKTRPKTWVTLEEPLELVAALKKNTSVPEAVIIDCLTLWLSNLILAGYNQHLIEDKIGKIMAQLKKNVAMSIIVANEVGLGIVPEHKLSREFRDIAGKINQIVAKESDEVIFMVSGIPTKIKSK